MRIVQATLEHLDLLTPLFVKYREFYGELPFPDSSKAFLEKRLRRKESVIYLALADEEDKLLGFCQLYPSYSSLALKRVWILNDIYVAEDARRQLVADRLLQTAKNMAKETNAVRMRVSTSLDNEVAHKVYESIGFTVESSSRTTRCPSARIEQHCPAADSASPGTDAAQLFSMAADTHPQTHRQLHKQYPQQGVAPDWQGFVARGINYWFVLEWLQQTLLKLRQRIESRSRKRGQRPRQYAIPALRQMRGELAKRHVTTRTHTVRPGDLRPLPGNHPVNQ